MATAKLVLPSGTEVTIEGTPEEVHRLLELHAQSEGPGRTSSRKPTKAKRGAKRSRAPKAQSPQTSPGPDLTEIVNLVKTSDEAEAIEEQILDRTGLVNRTLLPLYIVHEHLDNAYGLTSGDVKKITTDLGIPVSTPHASTTLSKTAARYVIGDSVRRKGVPVRYKLSRRGVQYMKNVIAGTANEG